MGDIRSILQAQEACKYSHQKDAPRSSDLGFKRKRNVLSRNVSGGINDAFEHERLKSI